MPEAIVHVSAVAGSPLLDSAGERLGRIDDVVARLDSGEDLPPVIGLKARIGGREVFVPIAQVEHLGPEAARSITTKLNLAQFERRPGEVLLRSDVLDRSLINVDTARLVTAREVELVCENGSWRVAGIDPSFRTRLWRLLPGAFAATTPNTASSCPGAHGAVRRPRSHLAAEARLAPAGPAAPGADRRPGRGGLVTRRARRSSRPSAADKELEADVFEELDDEHQVEFLRERSDPEVAAVLARMESDDAADLLLEIEQDRRLPVLNLMPPAKQRKIRSLLGYNPSTAGGLMDPDFVSIEGEATVRDALARIRASELGPDQLLDRLLGRRRAAS